MYLWTEAGRGKSKGNAHGWQTINYVSEISCGCVRGSPKLRNYLLNKDQRGAQEVLTILRAKYEHICYTSGLKRKSEPFNLVLIGNLIFLIILSNCHMMSCPACTCHPLHVWKYPHYMSLLGEQNSPVLIVAPSAKSSCLVQAHGLTHHAYLIVSDIRIRMVENSLGGGSCRNGSNIQLSRVSCQWCCQLLTGSIVQAMVCAVQQWILTRQFSLGWFVQGGYLPSCVLHLPNFSSLVLHHCYWCCELLQVLSINSFIS